MRTFILLTTLLGSVALAADPPANSYKPDKFAAKAYAAAEAAGATQTTNLDASDPTALAAGKKIFTTTCVSCHGAAGKGDGPAAMALEPRPANFTDHARWSAQPIGVLHWVVKNGIKGSAMVPLGLNDEQAWDVLAYIQHTFEPAVAQTTP